MKPPDPKGNDNECSRRGNPDLRAAGKESDPGNNNYADCESIHADPRVPIQMNGNNRVIQRSQRPEDPKPKYPVLFAGRKRRIRENATANPAQQHVVTVRVSFDCSGNEHCGCNQPSDIETSPV